MDNSELKKLNVARVVDARWAPCPGTLLEAKAGIRHLLGGEILEILSHDPEAHRDLAAWANKIGHELLGILESEGYYRIFVKKTLKDQ